MVHLRPPDERRPIEPPLHYHVNGDGFIFCTTITSDPGGQAVLLDSVKED
jgi:hypothetical protein